MSFGLGSEVKSEVYAYVRNPGHKKFPRVLQNQLDQLKLATAAFRITVKSFTSDENELEYSIILR